MNFTREIKGDETTARLKKPALFGKNWLKLPFDERSEIAKFLLKTEDPEAVKQRALDEWGLTEAQADAVSTVPLPSGYGNLSEKAIRKLIPHMEAGLIYSSAVSREYPHHSDFRAGEALDSLPYYGKLLERDVVGADRNKDPLEHGEPARYGHIPNPTVHIGLGQLRRVVNRLISSSRQAGGDSRRVGARSEDEQGTETSAIATATAARRRRSATNRFRGKRSKTRRDTRLPR